MIATAIPRNLRFAAGANDLSSVKSAFCVVEETVFSHFAGMPFGPLDLRGSHSELLFANPTFLFAGRWRGAAAPPVVLFDHPEIRPDREHEEEGQKQDHCDER